MDQAREEKRAGQVILSQLRLFNEAAVFFVNVLHPAFSEGVEDCTKKFLEANGWLGEINLESATTSWCAPMDWCLNPQEKKPDLKAYFCFDAIDGEKDYWMPLFCGVGSTGGRAGLAFYVESRFFGGRRAWKNTLENSPDEVFLALNGLGFQRQGDGSFFLPVSLDIEKLTQSWMDEEFDEVFSGDDDCFAPLRAALEVLERAVPHFNALMQYCLEEGSEKNEVLA